jgi:hypothetical protein
VEIESSIDVDDFNKLWSKGTNQVTKTRYIHEGWEVDFFKHGRHNYFGVAEIELPPGQKAPILVPHLVLENLIFIVPIDDKRFSNKKLGNISYTVSLLDALKVKGPTINREHSIIKKKYH